jgi:hypothetical protein
MKRVDPKSARGELDQVIHDMTEDHERIAREREQALALGERLNDLRSESHIATLRSAGVDLKQLEAIGKKEINLIHKNLAEFRKSTSKTKRDTKLRHRQAILRKNKAQVVQRLPASPGGGPISECWSWPEAAFCATSGGPDVACVKETSELEIKHHSTGLGGTLGIEAFGVVPLWGYLAYVYIPSVNGRLYVSPFPWVRGDYYLQSDDHWWSSTNASLNLTMKCRIWNGDYEDASDSATVLNRDISDGTISHTVDTLPWLQVSTNAVANRPVWIIVEADLEAIGHSDYAVADADFFSGADRYIRVAYIQWVLWPD